MSIHILSPKLWQKFPSFLPKFSLFWRTQVGMYPKWQIFPPFFYTNFFPVLDTLFIPVSDTLFIPVFDTLLSPLPIHFLSRFLIHFLSQFPMHFLSLFSIHVLSPFQIPFFNPCFCSCPFHSPFHPRPPCSHALMLGALSPTSCETGWRSIRDNFGTNLG